MRVKLLLLGIAYFLSILDKSDASHKCYRAKICIHDGKEKCGQDNMKGKIRRFLDSCDMQEYNCLRDTNFIKINSESCWNLPPIDKVLLADVKVNNDANENEFNVNESKFGVEDKTNKVDDADEVNKKEGNDDDDGASEEVKTVRAELEVKITSPKTTRTTIHLGQAAVINEYWCWRTKYCHSAGGVVCGRDRRLNERRKFKSACDLYQHNCDESHDFTVTDIKFCKGY